MKYRFGYSSMRNDCTAKCSGRFHAVICSVSRLSRLFNFAQHYIISSCQMHMDNFMSTLVYIRHIYMHI